LTYARGTPAQPIKGPGLIMTFACHCADCHKVCQMAAANFVVGDDSVKYLRGRADLATFTTGRTTTTGNDMTNYFCRACGTLMNRVSSGLPGRSILRTGTVDDFELQNTVLRPRHEIFTANRASWLAAIEGAEQHEGRPDWGSKL
jgi:hypothetical protein